MSEQNHKVAIVTGGSQGIGAGLVAGYRRLGWAVVATSRTIKPVGDPAVLTVDGDLSDPATTDRIISGALESFGRIDTLINNAGVFISKPFTDYTDYDYASVVGVNLTGFFWLTQRAITGMLRRGSGHVVNITTTLADNANSSTPSVLTSLTKGGLASATKSLAIEYASRGIRVTLSHQASSRRRSMRRKHTTGSLVSTRSGASARSPTLSTASFSWSHRHSSPERSCTSTAARSPATDPAPAHRPESDVRSQMSAGRILRCPVRQSLTLAAA
jgi:NAD(P)-dependent dehydrogenase (short-subunit alcohol dehydrogenase family)